MIDSDIYTEQEAANYLRKSTVCLRNARNRRKIGFIKGNPVTYRLQHLKDYLDLLEVKPRGKKPCAESQSSSSLQTAPEISNPLIGTSNITTEDEVSVRLRAVKSARKTMLRKSSSPPGSLNASAPPPENRIS